MIPLNNMLCWGLLGLLQCNGQASKQAVWSEVNNSKVSTNTFGCAKTTWVSKPGWANLKTSRYEEEDIDGEDKHQHVSWQSNHKYTSKRWNHSGENIWGFGTPIDGEGGRGRLTLGNSLRRSAWRAVETSWRTVASPSLLCPGTLDESAVVAAGV